MNASTLYYSHLSWMLDKIKMQFKMGSRVILAGFNTVSFQPGVVQYKIQQETVTQQFYDPCFVSGFLDKLDFTLEVTLVYNIHKSVKLTQI